ncbi:Detected protein of confused Function [Hibiscus syriacus]|uniref:Detected protein of confused Function n=1 Tax=Hibiscus syriacus TaxID=106335 RepID=A0A6A2XSJ2_HIBSY|nr:Detected protein of confused Function [Hibiscus syriacus]
MIVSGFEKRSKLHFFGDDSLDKMGLRLIDFESLEQVLHATQCTIISAIDNHFFDAYGLSESSLFVYPNKIIIKTCGITQLLKSVRPCYHSMNRDNDDHYSTIHVMPEDDYSYAIFKCIDFVYDRDVEVETLKKVIQVFKLTMILISTMSNNREVWTEVACAMESLGLKC